MTSKEALKLIKIKCHPNANPSPMIDEALNKIEKELEILEILKKNTIHYSADGNVYRIEIILDSDDDGFAEVLRWLERSK